MAVAAVVALMVLNSCEKKSEGLTFITYYPTVELKGDDVVVVNKGDSYVEPGYVSMLNGEDVTSGVEIISNLDTETSGVYSIVYNSITNEDGFSSSASRKVIVLDLNDPIEGIYAVDSEVSFRDYDGTNAAFKGDFEILLISNGDGTYEISDLFGGWYDQGQGYGSEYACTATMEIDGANVSVDPASTMVEGSGWPNNIDDFHDASYSSATGTLVYQVDYYEIMTFHVTLVKQSIE